VNVIGESKTKGYIRIFIFSFGEIRVNIFTLIWN